MSASPVPRRKPEAAPRFRLLAAELRERDVRFRLPFRFGAATLEGCPQAFLYVRVRLDDGREAEGAAAELLLPKWFDKDPEHTNERNVADLRASVAAACAAGLAAGADTAWGHHLALRRTGLVANYGPALLERAALDALCRALGVSFHEAVRRNLVGAVDEEGLDLAAFFARLRRTERVAVRHTVGLADALEAGEGGEGPGDGLPRTLAEAIERYGHRYFKLKLSGDPGADRARLCRIAAVLDRLEAPYAVTLDGNERYGDWQAVRELWAAVQAEPRLSRLRTGLLYLEQPLARERALEQSVPPQLPPVIIDESDDSAQAFARARALGYRGVSAKTCKGVYRALVNGARCAAWNAREGVARYFVAAEDLSVQSGLALQQDLALVSLLGIAHVERNGHHYANGMAGAPPTEQEAFLAAHPDLYERSHGAVRPRIVAGTIAAGSLDCPGYASRVLPDRTTLRRTM